VSHLVPFAVFIVLPGAICRPTLDCFSYHVSFLMKTPQFAIKKSNLREASRDASIELQQVEAYDGKTMENLQIKAGTNLTAATTVAGMQQITKIKGLDRRPDTIAFPIMDHIRIDHNMLCERAGLAPDAPDDRLQKA